MRQITSIGQVEQNETVHGNRLADVRNKYQVGICDGHADRSFAINTTQFTDSEIERI